jgi:hypothetical protein
MPGIGAAWPFEPATDRTDVHPLQFVEVRPNPARAGRANRPDRAAASDDGGPEATEDALPVTTPSSAEPRWSLWGEAEV